MCPEYQGLTQLQYIVCCLVLLFMSGCASYGKIENLPVTESSGAQEYSLRSFTRADKNDDLDLLLTFSGGGTRAAATAYGVMQELRDTTISINGETRRLLWITDLTITTITGTTTTTIIGTITMNGGHWLPAS
jgi:NTE family protein